MKIIRRLTSSFFWEDLLYRIQCFFNPKQKWLTKKIPKTWCDKVELLKLTCFESIVHFVEGENAFEVIDWEGSSHDHKVAKKELQTAYDIVKVQIPLVNQELDLHWEARKTSSIFDNFEKIEKDGEIFYKTKEMLEEEKIWTKQLVDLSAKLEELEQTACEIIIKNRNFMWT